MKKYTAQYVMNHMHLSIGAQAPAPFPGAYPTRFLVIGDLEGGPHKRTFMYLGKPNVNLVEQVTRIAESTTVRGLLHAWEFDRHSLIAEAYLALPWRDRGVRATSYCTRLQRYYYPLHALGIMFYVAYSTPFLYKGQIRRMYTPKQRVSSDELWRIREWLQANGF